MTLRVGGGYAVVGERNRSEDDDWGFASGGYR